MDENTTMSEKQFEELLHKLIPITETMGFSVEEFKPGKVRIGVKLAPNLSHGVTAFGGSINSAMNLCGWALVYSNSLSLNQNVHIVLQKSSIEYIKPITTDFVAECELINNEKRDRFFKTYKHRGKARLEVHVQIKDNQKILARFRGMYVVFKKRGTEADSEPQFL